MKSSLFSLIFVLLQLIKKTVRQLFFFFVFDLRSEEMSDFLAANNPCGQNLLQLVATGNAIIAELLRLADFVPPLFKFTNNRDAGKYAEIIFDFSYFSKQEYYDDFVNSRSVKSMKRTKREIFEFQRFFFFRNFKI